MTSVQVSSQALHSIVSDTMPSAGLSASTVHRVQADVGQDRCHYLKDPGLKGVSREGLMGEVTPSVAISEASCFPLAYSLSTFCHASSSRLVDHRSLILTVMSRSEVPKNGDATNRSKLTRRGVYLLTHPRSASNLFQTMMAKQKSHGADVQSSSYHFFNAAFAAFMQMGRGSLQSSNWTEVDRAALFEPYKAAFEGLNKELADAEEQVS